MSIGFWVLVAATFLLLFSMAAYRFFEDDISPLVFGISLLLFPVGLLIWYLFP